MAEALEEWASREIIHHDETIKGLQKELDGLTAENKRLEEEAEGLWTVKGDKALASAKAAENLALERAQKANKVSKNLRKEIDVERSSSVALLAEVELLKKQLDEAKTLGLSSAEACTTALTGFGKVTSSLLAGASASACLLGCPPTLLSFQTSLARLRILLRFLAQLILLELWRKVDVSTLRRLSGRTTKTRRGLARSRSLFPALSVASWAISGLSSDDWMLVP